MLKLKSGKQSEPKCNLVVHEETKQGEYNITLERRNNRGRLFDDRRNMAQPQQQAIEQCIIALTQLVTQNHQPHNRRTRIEKEIRFLPTFQGTAGTLPSFIEAVTRTLTDYGNEAELAFQIIYNTKIQGAAKNLLSVNPPATWDECKQRLRKHYKPSKDQMTITKEIGSLRVSSIKELVDKVRKLVEDITEYAAFDDNGTVSIDIFSGMLVQKLKELASGSLAYAIMTKNNLTEIRDILDSFIGQDQYNLRTNFNNRSFQTNNYRERNSNIQNKNQGSYTNHKPNNYYSRQYRYNNEQQSKSFSQQPNSCKTNQVIQNDDKKYQSRQSRQRPEPMEVDTLSKTETNTLDDTFFIN